MEKKIKYLAQIRRIIDIEWDMAQWLEYRARCFVNVAVSQEAFARERAIFENYERHFLV